MVSFVFAQVFNRKQVRWISVPAVTLIGIRTPKNAETPNSINEINSFFFFYVVKFPARPKSLNKR